MPSSKLRLVFGLLIMVVGVAGILVKFDKMPGVSLSNGKFEFGGGGGGGEDDAERGAGKAALQADGLRLGGLSGPASRRLAIVNNETFAAGESAQIKVLGEMVNLECLEIRNRSVIVQIEGAGEPVEVFLEKAGVPGSREKTAPRTVSTSPASPSTGQTERVEIDTEKVRLVSTQVPTNIASVKVDETTGAVEVLVGGQKIQIRE